MTINPLQNANEIGPGLSVLIPLDGEKKENIENAAREHGIEAHALLQRRIGKKSGGFVSLFHSNGEERALVFFHTGNGCHLARLRTSALRMARQCLELFDGRLCLDLRFVENEHERKVLDALLPGLMLGDYQVGKYKTTKQEEIAGIREWSYLLREGSELDVEAGIRRFESVTGTLRSCLELVNDPSNRKNARVLSEWAIQSAEDHGYETRILSKSDLERQGFHALLAVNRGSEIPACCIVSEYTPEGARPDAPTVALVGKGVTFDTGGLSIKPTRNMHYMKSDMGGAAAVLGATELAAKMRLPIRVVTIVPATDNSVDALSVKPGDVISSYHGSSIEVIDTDAEGRLILADGLAYAIRNYKPDYVVDVATLTGSVIRALGTVAAGLMTQDDELAAELIAAGERSGERLWRLPLWDDYDAYLQSDIADIRNLSDKPMAGSITAGKFLEHFTDDHPHWAHLDIAGTAFHQNPLSKGYSATGFGILLLLSWLEALAGKPRS